MPLPYRAHVPQSRGELLDLLGMIMLSSPTFEDKTDYLPGQSLENVFQALADGLAATRTSLGDDRYVKLVAMSRQARELFEADRGDKTGDAVKGRELVRDMEQLVKAKRGTR